VADRALKAVLWVVKWFLNKGEYQVKSPTNVNMEIYFGFSSDGKEGGSDGKEGCKDGHEKLFIYSPSVSIDAVDEAYQF
jgi:hypothetical protein